MVWPFTPKVFLLCLAVISSRAGTSPRLYRAPTGYAEEGDYLIVFENDISEDDMEGTAIALGFQRKQTFHDSIKAISLHIDDDDSDIIAARLKREERLRGFFLDSRVRFIEEIQKYSVQDSQEGPPYGLDRIDQFEGLDNEYRYELKGEGVTVYMLDTGIRSTHVEFEGRVSCGFNFFEDDEDCEDGHGHGTHVAGIVGGVTYGVAKQANLVTVKVLDSSGNASTGAILAGIQYVSRRAADSGVPVVANLSFAGAPSRAMNEAVASATANNVVFIVAAGNYGNDACEYSPASSSDAITVGGTDEFDTRGPYSNYGDCVDIFAPGTKIKSAGIEDDSDSASSTGTSMGAPHVAGVAALYIEEDRTLIASEIKQRILSDAVPDVVSDTRGSPNLLLSSKALLPPVPSPTSPDVPRSFLWAFLQGAKPFQSPFRTSSATSDAPSVVLSTNMLSDIPSSAPSHTASVLPSISRTPISMPSTFQDESPAHTPPDYPSWTPSKSPSPTRPSSMLPTYLGDEAAEGVALRVSNGVQSSESDGITSVAGLGRYYGLIGTTTLALSMLFLVF